MTQERLADAVGLSREHISRLERGISNESRASTADPTMTVLAALGQGLRATPQLDQARTGEWIFIFVLDDDEDRSNS